MKKSTSSLSALVMFVVLGIAVAHADFNQPPSVMTYTIGNNHVVFSNDQFHYTMTDRDSKGLCREGMLEDLITQLVKDKNTEVQVRFESCSEQTNEFAYVCVDIDETGGYEQGYCGAFGFSISSVTK